MTRDIYLAFALRTCAALAALVVVFIAVFLTSAGAPALCEIGLAFVTDDSWHPQSGTYGLAPMAVGTLLTTAFAMAGAGSLGLATAIYVNFYAPIVIEVVVRRVVELLAGIPSVVFGLWGLVVLVPAIARYQPPGASLLAGGLVLTLMVLPTIALLCDKALAAVPRGQIEGATALGCSRIGAIRYAVLPSARSGIAAALTLGFGRAVGETMAIVMVAGNVAQVPRGLFDPVRTLTANIALEISYAMGTHKSALFVSGLLLIVLSTVVVVVNDRLRAAP